LHACFTFASQDADLHLVFTNTLKTQTFFQNDGGWPALVKANDRLASMEVVRLRRNGNTQLVCARLAGTTKPTACKVLVVLIPIVQLAEDESDRKRRIKKAKTSNKNK
jgi:hypothetical protein